MSLFACWAGSRSRSVRDYSQDFVELVGGVGLEADDEAVELFAEFLSQGGEVFNAFNVEDHHLFAGVDGFVVVGVPAGVGEGLGRLPGVPGPGLLVILAGIAVLAIEFVWARRLLRRFRTKGEEMKKRYRDRCFFWKRKAGQDAHRCTKDKPAE